MSKSQNGHRDASGKLVRHQLYTLRQAAEWFAVSEKTVRRWIDGGHLRAHRIGRQIRIAEDDLATFLVRRELGVKG